MTCRNFKYTTDIFKQLFPKFSRRQQINDPKTEKTKLLTTGKNGASSSTTWKNAVKTLLTTGGCSARQSRVLRRVRCRSVLLYSTAPAQKQGANLPAMRHRKFDFSKIKRHWFFFSRREFQYSKRRRISLSKPRSTGR